MNDHSSSAVSLHRHLQIFPNALTLAAGTVFRSAWGGRTLKILGIGLLQYGIQHLSSLVSTNARDIQCIGRTGQGVCKTPRESTTPPLGPEKVAELWECLRAYDRKRKGKRTGDSVQRLAVHSSPINTPPPSSSQDRNFEANAATGRRLIGPSGGRSRSKKRERSVESEVEVSDGRVLKRQKSTRRSREGKTRPEINDHGHEIIDLT